MGEFYTELLIKKKNGAKEKLLKVLVVALVLFSVPTVLMFRFGILLLAASIAIAVVVFTKLDVEYEYLYYEGDIDVDIIYRKMKRKRVFSVSVNEMEMLAPMNSIEVKHYDRLKSMDYSSGIKQANKYVMIILKNGQKIRMIFEPNDKIVNDLYYRAPRKVIRN